MVGNQQAYLLGNGGVGAGSGGPGPRSRGGRDPVDRRGREAGRAAALGVSGRAGRAAALGVGGGAERGLGAAGGEHVWRGPQRVVQEAVGRRLAEGGANPRQSTILGSLGKMPSQMPNI